MVTGGEYIFDNIDQALDYILETERRVLMTDANRREPPRVIRPYPGVFLETTLDRLPPVPVDSLHYPLSAWFNDAPNDKFVMTSLLSGRYSLKPNLKTREFLYRGETEFHQPCKPNLSRNPYKHRFTAELAKGQEMMLLMLSHPLVQLLDIGVELNGKVYQFEMNLFGLTQHYYNKTSLLDLTSNPQVAAFFATAKYDLEKDSYYPIEDEHHEPGVLYFYTLDINEDFGTQMGTRRAPLSTIGLQVFPRSGRQSGFLYNMQTHENFNDVARLNAFRFRHNANIAKRICESFHNGKDLFPDDILMRHWKREGRDYNVISNRTVKMNHLWNPQMSLEEVDAEIRSAGFDIQDYKPSFTQKELDEYYDSVQNGFWMDLCKQIHIPGDNNSRMMNDLINLPKNPKYRWAFERDDGHMTDYELGNVLRQFKECLK